MVSHMSLDTLMSLNYGKAKVTIEKSVTRDPSATTCILAAKPFGTEYIRYYYGSVI